jgi:hypothetical protein
MFYKGDYIHITHTHTLSLFLSPLCHPYRAVPIWPGAGRRRERPGRKRRVRRRSSNPLHTAVSLH